MVRRRDAATGERRRGEGASGGGGGEPFTIRATVARAVNGATGSSLDIYVEKSPATTRAGTYDVVASLLTRDSVNTDAGGTKGGTFRSVRFENGASAVTVAPGALDVSKSRVDAADVSIGGAVGEVVYFSVYPADAHGNLVSAADAAAIVCAATAVNVDDGSVVAAPTVQGSLRPPTRRRGDAMLQTRNENERSIGSSGSSRRRVQGRRRGNLRHLGGAQRRTDSTGGFNRAPQRALSTAEPAASRCFMSDQGTLGTVSVAGNPDGVWFDVTARDAFDNVATDSNDLVFDVHALPADGSVPTRESRGRRYPSAGEGTGSIRRAPRRNVLRTRSTRRRRRGRRGFPVTGVDVRGAARGSKQFVRGWRRFVRRRRGRDFFVHGAAEGRERRGASLGAGESLFARVDLPANGSTGLRAPDSLSRVEASDRVGAWIVRYTAYNTLQGVGERYSIIVGVESAGGGTVREISGSPFAMTVVAGDVDAANTFARPNAVLGAYRSSADVWGTFDAVARDAHNNSVHLGDSGGGYRGLGNWIVEMDGATRWYVRGGVERGVVSPVFNVTAGTYSVTVRHDGVAIGPGGSPRDVHGGSGRVGPRRRRRRRRWNRRQRHGQCRGDALVHAQRV